MEMTKPKLSKEASALWDELIATLPKGHLEQCDKGVLKAYCEANADLDNARDQWRKKGRPWTMVHKTGAEGVHPLVQAMKQQSTLVATLASKLRICPSARTRTEKAGRQQHRPPSKRAHLLP